jgi:hypothetical protein
LAFTSAPLSRSVRTFSRSLRSNMKDPKGFHR